MINVKTTENSVKLLTKDKFCNDDINVTFEGGSGGDYIIKTVELVEQREDRYVEDDGSVYVSFGCETLNIDYWKNFKIYFLDENDKLFDCINIQAIALLNSEGNGISPEIFINYYREGYFDPENGIGYCSAYSFYNAVEEGTEAYFGITLNVGACYGDSDLENYENRIFKIRICYVEANEHTLAFGLEL